MGDGLSATETEELVDFAKDLIRIPSSVKDGDEIYEFVKSYLEKRGLRPAFQSIRSSYIDYPGYSNLCLKIGNGKGPKIMLNCHLDTVMEQGNWFYPPFEAHEEDGKIFGLGAADMKGGCAAAIYSIGALANRKKEINGELFLSCVFGEEAPFSLGTDTLLREFDFKNYDLIIVTEPSPLLAINDFCFVHKKLHKNPKFPVTIIGAEGRILFEIEFFGKSAHASHPSQGVNAIQDAARVVEQLTNFDLFSSIKMGRGHYVVINIEGGDQSFTVPSYCKIYVNRQLTLGETQKMVTDEINKIIRTLRLKSNVRVLKRYSPAPELEYRPYVFEESEYIVRFMKRLPELNPGKRCRFTTSSVGDFNLFATRTGVPTIVFGPGGGYIHSPNEFVFKDEIVNTANYLVDFFLEVF